MGRNEPNGAWQYPPPLDLSPQNLDWDTWQGTVPKRAFNPLIFARWRAWTEYGTGVAGDLLVHLVSGMQFMLGVNEPPTQASALGGIRHWKDGRNMPDVHAVLYQYRDMPPVYMRLNLATAMPETYRIQGSRGLLEVTPSGVSFTPQLGVDTGPSYYAGSFPQAMRAEYARGWHEEHDSELAKAAVQESVSFRMPNYDDLTPHLANFFDAVRTRRPVVEDVVFGHNAALACHMANESYFRKTSVTWDAVAKTIKG